MKKLNFSRNNPKFAAALILALTASAFLAVSPFANAHTPAWNIPTYAFIAVIPNTQQVNQPVEIVFWINNVPPTAGGLGGDKWHNFMVNVTAPDGTKSQLGPYDSDQLGSYYALFTPTQTGNYKFQFYWPGQTAELGTGVPNYERGLPYIGDFFQPSVSNVVTLQVQQGPTVTWQNTPTPTGYWELPISALNRDNWGNLASNWLGGAWLQYGYQTEGQAPSSPHILWQIPIVPGFAGGLLDAQWFGVNTNTRVYETPFGSPIIMNGVVYYNTPPVATTGKYGYYAVDLYTGKQLWYNNGSSIPGDMYLNTAATGAGVGAGLSQFFAGLSVGQLYHVYDVNGNGIVSYLWSQQGSNWYMLDASTGNWLLTIKNVPSGTAAVDQDGSLLLYSYNSATGNLLCWNSSQSIPRPGPTGTAQQQWKIPVGTTIDALNDTTWTTFPVAIAGGVPVWTANQVRPRSGYTMNVTIPKGLTPGSISNVLLDENRVPRQIFGWSNPGAQSGIFGGSGIMYAWCVQINYNAAPYSPYPNETESQNNNLGYTATLLWNRTYTPPASGNLTYYLATVDYPDQVFTIWNKETRQNWGYSLKDGSLIWGPTDSGLDFDLYSFSISQPNAYAYGNIYRSGYGGQVRAYDAKTGTLKWTYTATGIGLESPYNNYPLNYILGICDGKLYAYTNLGYVQQPLWRGVCLHCINATTGELIWKINHYPSGGSIADGYLVSGDFYNNQITCFGKGPSATTVSTQDTAAPLGTPVLIKGTVTDQSPGAQGTPAVSEASIQQWMEYLYKQQAMPTNATGVSVHLTALDPNGNAQDIGFATSDTSGNYAASWTPPVPGVYKIKATFSGSNSYGDSNAQTSLLVSSAASPAAIVTPVPTQTAAPIVSPVPTQTPTSPSPSVAPQPASGMPTATYLAIGAAVIIIVAAAALILRKRK